eukprot:GHVT01050446.1.p1 GENE.GHVT01050446.1~~GHVT01050446.1.p1  ORF type:complete len:150 (-),score=36.70 GHVT01050446.1:85-534(-)
MNGRVVNGRRAGGAPDGLQDGLEFVHQTAKYSWDTRSQEWLKLYGVGLYALQGPCEGLAPVGDEEAVAKWEAWRRASAYSAAVPAGEYFLLLLDAVRPGWREEKADADARRARQLNQQSRHTPTIDEEPTTPKTPTLDITKHTDIEPIN